MNHFHPVSIWICRILGLALLIKTLHLGAQSTAGFPTNPPPPAASGPLAGTATNAQVVLPLREGMDYIFNLQKALSADASAYRDHLEKCATQHKSFVEVVYSITAGLAALFFGVIAFLSHRTKTEIKQAVDGQVKKFIAKRLQDEVDGLTSHYEQELAVLKAEVQVQHLRVLDDVQAGNSTAFLLTSVDHPENSDMRAIATTKALECLKLSRVPKRSLRQVGILFGRMEKLKRPKDTKDETIPDSNLMDAINGLNQFIDAWPLRGDKDEEEHDGEHFSALLYNRACYRNRLARTCKEGDRPELRRLALGDLSKACKLDPSNLTTAKADDELSEIVDLIK